jgi:outer membrane protein
MKQNKAIIIIFTFIGLNFFSAIYAQQKWSLERCIIYALENNIHIKQQELNTKYRNNALTQSQLNLLPSVNSDFSIGSTSGRALDQTTYQFSDNQTITSSSLSATASLTLFNGFQKINSIRENRMNLFASLHDLEKLKNDISLNIAAGYLQIILSHELLTAAINQLDITNQQVDRTVKLVNAGSLPKANLLEIQAQAASQEVQVVSAQNQLDLSYLTLIQLLELETVSGFEIEIPDIDIPESQVIIYNVDDIFVTSEAVLPQIKSAEYRLMAARRGLNIARGGHSPSIFLSGTYYTGYSDARQRAIGGDSVMFPIGFVNSSGENVSSMMWLPRYGNYSFMDQFSENASTNISLNVRIPIFNGWMVNNAVSNAKIAISNSEYALQNEKNILYREIQQAYADALASLKKFKASEKALEAMEESFGYTRQRYEVGLVNVTDFNAAQNQLAVTRSDLLISKYEYIFKLKILDFYQGKSITLSK